MFRLVFVAAALSTHVLRAHANFTAGLCENDRNCSGTKVCYQNPQWASSSAPPSFCDCESWYGWVGENCLSLGVGAQFLLIIHSIVLTLRLFALAVIVYLLVQFSSLSATLKARFVAGFGVTIVMGVAYVVGVVERCVLIAEVATPQLNNAFIDGSSFSAKEHQLFELDTLLLNFLMSLLALCALTLPLLWIEEFVWTKGVDPAMVLVSAYSYEVVILVCDVLFVVTSSVVSSREDPLLFTGLQAPLILGGLYIYAFLPRTLEVCANSHEETVQHELDTVLMLVRKSRRFVLAGLLAIFFGIVTFVITRTRYRDLSRPGDIPIISTVFSLTTSSFDLCFGGITWYLWKLSTAFADLNGSMMAKESVPMKEGRVGNEML